MELAGLLKSYWPELGTEAFFRVQKFYQLLVQENQVQNLTRLIEPSAFIEGHLVDVRELLKTGFLEFPAMDLGSGGGVPGLLVALIQEHGGWVLAEAEVHKAEFLLRAVKELGVADRVQVFHGRAEDFLKSNQVQTVVARAVGPVDRIYSWIRTCSTWNKLVLLKGPGWSEEWQRFLVGRDGKKLEWKRSAQYLVGADEKKRIIVELVRNVPRGT